MRTVSFPFQTEDARPVTVTARIADNAYEVEAAARDHSGALRACPVSADDLEAIEAALDAAPLFKVRRTFSVVTVHALDVRTGETTAFTVYHEHGRVLEARFADTGYALHEAGEQFTEVAEAFAIDRAYDDAEDFRHMRGAY